MQINLNTFYNTNLANINKNGMIKICQLKITLVGFFLCSGDEYVLYTCIYMEIDELLSPNTPPVMMNSILD